MKTYHEPLWNIIDLADVLGVCYNTLYTRLQRPDAPQPVTRYKRIGRRAKPLYHKTDVVAWHTANFTAKA